MGEPNTALLLQQEIDRIHRQLQQESDRDREPQKAVLTQDDLLTMARLATAHRGSTICLGVFSILRPGATSPEDAMLYINPEGRLMYGVPEPEPPAMVQPQSGE
jgi:hypothetical protein